MLWHGVPAPAHAPGHLPTHRLLPPLHAGLLGNLTQASSKIIDIIKQFQTSRRFVWSSTLQSNHGDHLCTLLDRLLDRNPGALAGEAAVGGHRVAALLQTVTSCSEDEVSRVNLIISRMGRRPLLDWEPSPGRWQLIVYPSPADLIGRGDGSCSQYGYIGYTGLHWRWGGNMIIFRHVSDVWCTYLI